MKNTILIRSNEIINGIASFSKETYHRDDVLSELFKLQEEAVKLTFNDNHAELGNLRLYDVSNHLKQLCVDRYGDVIPEVDEFCKSSFALNNLIKAELSGRKGEGKAFRILSKLNNKRAFLKNIELSDKVSKSELDAIVITSKAIFIVEVKNTTRDIFISEDGCYYRMSEYMRKDCNIGYKMDLKESLLRSALSDTNLDNIKIEKIVVFTNDEIEVHNKYNAIQVAFLNYLPMLIDDYVGDDIYSDTDISSIVKSIENNRCSEEYPVDEVVKNFKKSYAIAMATLETKDAKETVEERIKIEIPERKTNIWSTIEKIAASPYAKEVGYALAEIAITALATKLVKKHAA